MPKKDHRGAANSDSKKKRPAPEGKWPPDQREQLEKTLDLRQEWGTCADLSKNLNLVPNKRPTDWSVTWQTVLALLAAAGAGDWWSKRQALEEDIRTRQKRLSTQAQEISSLKEGSKEKESRIRSLEADLEELRVTESLRHLLDRVGRHAQEALLSGDALRNLFLDNKRCSAYVMSIDLRRSTDLMLKAREPQLFAEFITELAGRLKSSIQDSNGVFDKFTGDGILAFFPEFFSGPQAGLLAVDAAQRCHEAFDAHYRQNRKCFTSVLQSTGLGIGIDYGEVSMVQMQGELTVVGGPVVYACRLGGADAGETLVNQPAYEVLLASFSEHIDFRESEMHFKNEGPMLAYAVSRNEKAFEVELPEWARQLPADGEGAG